MTVQERRQDGFEPCRIWSKFPGVDVVFPVKLRLDMALVSTAQYSKYWDIKGRGIPYNWILGRDQFLRFAGEPERRGEVNWRGDVGDQVQWIVRMQRPRRGVILAGDGHSAGNKKSRLGEET